MSEYESDLSPVHGSETQQDDNTLDEAVNTANNSIIGKVKSRVSSIIPTRLSNWFSPSSKNNDSINGKVGSNTSRRRRRIEIEDEEDGVNLESETSHRKGQDENIENDDDDEDDEESNSSEEENTAAASCVTNTQRSPSSTRSEMRQPPAKRSRFNLDNSNMRDGVVLSRQPLVASTPTLESNFRGSSSSNVLSTCTSQRHTYLNLYGHQSQKEPPYKFLQTNELSKSTVSGPDTVGVTSLPPTAAENNSEVSSRRCLNIPISLTTPHSKKGRFSPTLTHLKRQSLASVKKDIQISNARSHSNSLRAVPQRTSTTLRDAFNEEGNCSGNNDMVQTKISETNAKKCNGRTESTFAVTVKKSKPINGTGQEENPSDYSNNNEALSVEPILVDSASESGESGVDGANVSNVEHRKTGLFNMSSTNSRNVSRTSSFGNSLNFYSHLEGRKSLFSGGAQVSGGVNSLNNSTLSLTSLNRRQFNASIYGSTSALSDSRLLNTFSPFYKGKTTYGGAAAYNKYAANSVTGAGASVVRITPTLIRPTSSLSTLSSSSNSLAVTSIGIAQSGDNSTISSTAKRILDLINEFATPLSEAKKMASNLKANQQQQLLPQAKNRLNDADLQVSRAMRLSHVRTPYMRPNAAVVLQPTGNANVGKSMVLPPVRELQVPSMSQLLQMKKMQNTTERVRQIANLNTHSIAAVAAAKTTEYTLPVTQDNSVDDFESQRQQRHTNKMRNRGKSSLRATAAKNIDDTPPPPVNLPNIAFPLMQSVPQIDIALPVSSLVASSVITTITTPIATTVRSVDTGTTQMPNSFNKVNKNSEMSQMSSVMSLNGTLNSAPGSCIENTAGSLGFKFSTPIEIKEMSMQAQDIIPVSVNSYKFSQPTYVQLNAVQSTSSSSSETTKPQLKTGSVMEALSKPFLLPTTTKALTTSNTSFGSQFKKSADEWDCKTCMVRNKQNSKCIACETPREQPVQAPSASFGNQFKKAKGEWECDTCMVRNKPEVDKCVACETSRKDKAVGSALSSLTSPAIQKSSGNTFVSKTNSWECGTCLVSNESVASECVACQAKKPGTASDDAPVTSFKFGFPGSTSAQTNVNTTARMDAGFKALAAEQKASKWECEACMTRNEAHRNKCVCCEQAKPGCLTSHTDERTTQFAFGASAAAKFNFGFGATANVSKEKSEKEDEKISTLDEKSSTQNHGFSFGNTATPLSKVAGGEYSFGFKPTAVSESNQEMVDNSQQSNITLEPSPSTIGNKFGVVAKEDGTVSSATGNFVFGAKPVTAITTSVLSGANSVTTTTSITTSSASSTTSVELSTPITKPSEPSKGSEAPKTIVPTFSFGDSNSSKNPGFSFGSIVKSGESKTEDFAFKAPVTSTTVASDKQVGFGSLTTNFAAAVSNSSTTTATAAVKPMFSFGIAPVTTTVNAASSVTTTSSSFSVAPIVTTTVNATTTAPTGSSFGGFSFGSNLSSSFTVPTSIATSIAQAVMPATTAVTNVFGSFGDNTVAPGFTTSATVASSAAVLKTSTTTPSTTVSTFAPATTTSTNVFGSFGSQASFKSSAPLFGSVESTSAPSSTGNKTFAFGSIPATTTVITTPTPMAFTSTVTTTSATSVWPKNSFVFGTSSSNVACSVPDSSAATVVVDAPKPVTFGSFGSTTTGSTASAGPQLFFGNASSSAGFGGNTSTSSSTSIFGTNTAPVTSTGSLGVSNIFGAVPSSKAITSTPTFGASPFGGVASTSMKPMFGSAPAVSSTPFGGFGNVPSASTDTGGPPAVKKTESAFNFGSISATQNTSGGFNFGSNATSSKPAFNFATATTNQPAFNFTGSAEATPNAPFQFNAGVAPASSNIFAPTPTSGGQTAQQARRKMRAPIRRSTQR